MTHLECGKIPQTAGLALFSTTAPTDAALESATYTTGAHTVGATDGTFLVFRIIVGDDIRDYSAELVMPPDDWRVTSFVQLHTTNTYGYYGTEVYAPLTTVVTPQKHMLEAGSTHYRGGTLANKTVIDASGFSTNLDDTITDTQLLADAVDALSTGGGGGGGSFTSTLILDEGSINDSTVSRLGLTENIAVGHLIEFTINTAGAEGTFAISGDEWLTMVEHTTTPTDVSEAKGFRLNSNATALTNRVGRSVYLWRSNNANEVYAKGVSIGGTLTLSVRKSSLGGPTGPQGIPGTAGAGLAAVSHDSTLTGDGTAADELAVANPFTPADELKLDGIAPGAQVNVGVEFTSSNRTKLNGIETGAEANLDNYEHSVLTQATYDAITTPDSNTIYLVTA